MNQVTILIVDDEPDLLDNVSLALESEGYQVLTARDGAEALARLQTNPIDLILADIAMPDMNGYQLYERVRQNLEWLTIPFIFLTARTLDSDIRFGKELGVDDYLTKPIRTGDLLAVVHGKLRRAQELAASIAQLKATPASEAGRALVIGSLRINVEQHRVWLAEKELELSVREFILLDVLAQRAGRVVSPQEIIQSTHDLETDPIEAGALLRPLILSLRRKLDSAAQETPLVAIENVRGVGYRLVVPTQMSL
jgi:DNA-binding response OmpR family regulator